MKQFHNGFLMRVFDFLINLLIGLSLIEVIKKLYIRKNGWCPETGKNINCIIDFYILIKWIIMFVFWIIPAEGLLINSIVVYLISTNLLTYFYHHFWNVDQPTKVTSMRIKRRFVSMMQAFLFSSFGFAYLYYKPLSWGLETGIGLNDSIGVIVFSLSNALFVDTSAMTITDAKLSIPIILQHISTFIFVTIIISKSLSDKSS